MDDSRIVEVYAAANGIQAAAIRCMLTAAGIDAVVVGDLLAASAGMAVTGQNLPARVWARQSDRVEARRLIAVWEARARAKSASSPPVEWTCSECGADVDDGLDACWNCRNPRQPD